MFSENNNSQNSTVSGTSMSTQPQQMTGVAMTYTKTNKLITALYMITDIMDKAEPIRLKLRILGADILSDMHSNNRATTAAKVEEVMSFLSVASTLNMISEMNKNILFSEFSKLKESLKPVFENTLNLETFFNQEEPTFLPSVKEKDIEKDEMISNRHHSLNIGMQKGSTLMQAISKKLPTQVVRSKGQATIGHESFDMLKKERRFEIIRFIKDNKVATIKDIKDKANGVLKTCGEKTLQRELIAMVHDGVLKKVGDKRWSKYFLS